MPSRGPIVRSFERYGSLLLHYRTKRPQLLYVSPIPNCILCCLSEGVKTTIRGAPRWSLPVEPPFQGRCSGKETAITKTYIATFFWYLLFAFNLVAGFGTRFEKEARA